MRTRLKICGITRLQDADQVVAVGADGLGLICYPPSPRYVDITVAAAIAAQVPPLIDVIAVFVNPSADQVDAVLQRVAVSVLQFHGDESPTFCSSFGVPYIKTLRVSDEDVLGPRCAGYSDAGAMLLDTHDAALYGGTGRTFPWHLARTIQQIPVILAGGLTEETVSEAIRLSGAYAVDVSSGVESTPGIKDANKIARFARAVRDHDASASDVHE